MNSLKLTVLLSVAISHYAVSEESIQSQRNSTLAVYKSGDNESAGLTWEAPRIIKLAEERILSLAEDNYAESQWLLGGLYHQGIGADQDLQQAAVHYQAAADAGHPLAQNAIGRFYYKGLGVQQNLIVAAKYLEQAAAQEVADAQVFLGRMYISGAGVPINYRKALELLTAASHSNHDAMALIGAMYVKGLGVEKDFHEAFKWYHQAAQGGTREFIADVKKTRNDVADAAGIELETKIVPMEGSGLYALSNGRLIEYDPVLSDFKRFYESEPVQVLDIMHRWRKQEPRVTDPFADSPTTGQSKRSYETARSSSRE